MPKQPRQRSLPHRCANVGVFWVLFFVAMVVPSSFVVHRMPQHSRTLQPSRHYAVRHAGIQTKNPVKTASDTLNDFYKAYSQPPLLPVYRPFIIDLLTQVHLAIVDTRFKYDAVFALGFYEYFHSQMGLYDKTAKGAETEKIWVAMLHSIGLEPKKVKNDADAMRNYAKSTSPSKLFKHLEGTERPSESKAADAFQNIKKNLYTLPFSVGLFKIMESCGVETTSDNVQEWAKALGIAPNKGKSDLETWKQNQNKMQKAEEMLRDVEIREKKKLAEKLEQKAKALTEKAQQR